MNRAQFQTTLDLKVVRFKAMVGGIEFWNLEVDVPEHWRLFSFGAMCAMFKTPCIYCTVFSRQVIAAVVLPPG